MSRGAAEARSPSHGHSAEVSTDRSCEDDQVSCFPKGFSTEELLGKHVTSTVQDAPPLARRPVRDSMNAARIFNS